MSKVVPGVHERVLTVSGDVEAVAKVHSPRRLAFVSATSSLWLLTPRCAFQAYRLIVLQLLDAGPSSPTTPLPPSNTSIRLLISHNLMGTIIGRNGLKIKAIQDASGARMVASKEILPQSTERIVEVQGSADSIGSAIGEIGKCLLEDWERGVGTVLFHPGATSGDDRNSSVRRGGGSWNANAQNGTRRTTGDGSQRGRGNGSPPSTPPQAPSTYSSQQQPSNLRTQNISIPSDMVGCIIGRSGTKITEIRRLSGSKISIAKTPHDETGERMFTIVGTPEANEKALFLLYNQLESEKERRVGREAQSHDAA